MQVLVIPEQELPNLGERSSDVLSLFFRPAGVGRKVGFG